MLVDKLPAIVELAAPVVLTIPMSKAGATGIGLRQYEVSRDTGSFYLSASQGLNLRTDLTMSLRPATNCTDCGCESIPCQESARPTISNLPVNVFASLVAASLASLPVLGKKTLSRPGGSTVVNRLANRSNGRVSMHEYT